MLDKKKKWRDFVLFHQVKRGERQEHNDVTAEHRLNATNELVSRMKHSEGSTLVANHCAFYVASNTEFENIKLVTIVLLVFSPKPFHPKSGRFSG